MKIKKLSRVIVVYGRVVKGWGDDGINSTPLFGTATKENIQKRNMSQRSCCT